MQELVRSTRTNINVLARKARHSHTARKAAVAGMVIAPMISTAFAADGDITSADFTSLATKVLTYLGYAVAAGLTVLVAVIAAKKGWAFFNTFIRA